ncbi:hypothetical protein AB1Y20_013896 [Prymnesium parvum]|uniref:NADP-dependent oxidoreductase domain-containing protein n=1 Tax=Prymnesium parvum TaxID=97485 RepID=A0AB34II66_PRYPA
MWLPPLFLSLLSSLPVATSADAPPPPLILDGDASKPMPALGFGTCCRKSAHGAPLVRSAKAFLAEGGRLIDTAQMYANHAEIARAVREAGVPRGELWLTSKVNTKEVRTREATRRSVHQSARELGVEYIDLMLIHGMWTISEEEAVEVWRGLLDAKKDGVVRHVGVSNFEKRHIQRLVADTGVRPSALQLEYHPWSGSEVDELVAWCQQQGIAVTAYGSLGGSANGARGEAVARLAAARHVTAAQLLLRWGTSRGVAVIPGATSVEHIRANLNLPPLRLSEEELRILRSQETRPAKFTSWLNLPSELGQRAHHKGSRRRLVG